MNEEQAVAGTDETPTLDAQLDNWALMIERGGADAEDLPWIAKKLREAAAALRGK